MITPNSLYLVNQDIGSSNMLINGEMNLGSSSATNPVVGDSLIGTNLIDQVNDSFNFLHNVMNSAASTNNLSTSQLLEIQDQMSRFNITTSLVNKVGSTLIKDVDTLTRMQ